jgi:flagella basal body P-ring formation protein FlgA
MVLRFCLFLLGLAIVVPAFADTNVRLVVPTHDIARGEVISESDLAYQSVAAGLVYPGAITDPVALAGMEARRVLRAGESLRLSDVRHPVLVAKGATVTMTFAAPGIELTAVGRAMTEGGLGETVVVQNPVSFRQVSAVVTGSGEVRAAASFASNKP